MNIRSTLTLIMLAASTAASAGPFTGFVENRGQLRDQCGDPTPQVRFLWPTGEGLNVQVMDHALRYDRYRPIAGIAGHFSYDHVEMRFEGASAMPRVQVAGTHADRFHFVGRGSDVVDVRHHDQVQLQELYPGVTLDLRIVDRMLKYDIVATHPRQLEQVRIRYTGYDAITVRGNELVLRMGDDELIEHIPASWVGAERAPVEVIYEVIEESDGEAVLGLRVVKGIEPGRGGRLVVDPTVRLRWGTYHGGELADAALAVAMDKHGFSYVAGRTAGAPTFVTTGAGQSVHAGGATDAFVSRIAPQGSRIWTTYYGGEGEEEIHAITVDEQFRVRLGGWTTSTTGMATDSAAQLELAGGRDAFLALFDSTGLRAWSTYIGGMAEEMVTDVFAFPDGRTCACGWSEGADLFDTLGVAPAVPRAGGRDGFVACFDAQGLLERSTFVGGPGEDELAALLVANDSTLHAVGSTTGGLTFTVDTARGGVDALYLVLDTAFAVLHAHLFGGAADDAFTDVTVADSSMAMCGHTRSTGLAINAVHPDTLGGIDALLVHYRDQQVLGATYLGGPGDDHAVSLFHDAEGWTFVAGSSVRSVVDTLAEPMDTIPMGTDVFVTMMKGTDTLAVQRYYGGIADEDVADMAMYGLSILSVVGATTSMEGIATEGFQLTLGGEEDVFVSVFETDRSTPCYGISPDGPNGPCSGGGSAWWNGNGGGGPWEPQPEPFLAVCLGDSITLCTSGGYLCNGHYWMWYHSVCGDPVNFMEIGECVTFMPTQNMTIYVRSEGVDVTGPCTKVNIVVDTYPEAIATAPDHVCQSDSIPLNGTGGVIQTWTGPADLALTGASVNAPSDQLQGQAAYVLTASSQFGCLDHDTVSVMVHAVPNVAWNTTDVACHGGAQGSIALASDTLPAPGITFLWPASGDTTASLSGLMAGTYAVVITDTLGCQRTDSLVLVEPMHPLDTVLVHTATCGAANGSVEVLLLAAAGPHAFSWGEVPGDSAFITDLPAGMYTATYVHPAGCTYQVTATVGDTGTFVATLWADPTTILLGDSTRLEVSMIPEQPGATIAWNTVAGLACDTCLATFAMPTTDVTYRVQITSTLGCISSDSVAITVELPPVPAFFLPSHFSPNGDGLNDVFQPLGGEYTAIRMVITSLLGQEVFGAEGMRPLWDGTDHGSPAQGGPYHVLVQAVRADGAVDVFDHQITLMR
ncbi:MAG: gliding motility-associated C-terminal domain-containing protein [Flavobacteriales bacterium]|nr:gliding motility-associated C-terminal domain-containing protein [Flavobacteriales bacterium]